MAEQSGTGESGRRDRRGCMRMVQGEGRIGLDSSRPENRSHLVSFCLAFIFPSSCCYGNNQSSGINYVREITLHPISN